MMANSVSPDWIRGRVIGRGSYGTVSLGFPRRSGRVFAVKSVSLHSHPRQIDSLENEIQILSSLDYSPYIVQYLGDDISGSHRNLHLELLPGGTVTDDAAARRRDGKFYDEGTLRLHVRCLVSALRYVHSRGIVHCDVKGRNVIVGRDPTVAKLVDFGSAIGAGSRTEPRGSPLWMAPEVVRGEYQGPESDVWALGCTLIEMVRGRPGWEDEGAETLSRIAFLDEVPKFPAELSPLGRDFLGRCLRRDPKERWSCNQLLHHPFLASEMAAEADSSPRCVLDWWVADLELEGGELESQLESDDENALQLEMEMESFPEAEPGCLGLGRGRVRELCHDEEGVAGPAPSWESGDGWVVVRENQFNSARESPGTGASSEYCGASGAERENGRRGPEYLNGTGGREHVEGKWKRSCEHGTGEEGEGEGEEEEEEEEEAQGDYYLPLSSASVVSVTVTVTVVEEEVGTLESKWDSESESESECIYNLYNLLMCVVLAMFRCKYNNYYFNYHNINNNNNNNNKENNKHFGGNYSQFGILNDRYNQYLLYL